VIVGVLGLSVAPMAGAMIGAGAAAMLMAICTADGPREMVLDGAGNPVPADQAPPERGCPFCVAHPGYTLPPPLAPEAMAPVPVVADSAMPGDAGILPAALFLCDHAPRGPPAGPA